MIRAYFTNRSGAGCVRTVETAQEAEKIMRGGYGATEARLEDESGEIIGERVQDDGTHGVRGKWFWWFDQDAFKGQS